MLPNPHHLPAALAKLQSNSAISVHVRSKFVLPKGDIRFRLPVAFSASVPEATIDENRDFFSVKDKIRAPRKRRLPAPTAYLSNTQKRDDPLLSALISPPPHQRHLPRPCQRRPLQILHFVVLSPDFLTAGNCRISNMKRAKMSLRSLYGFASEKCFASSASIWATGF